MWELADAAAECVEENDGPSKRSVEAPSAPKRRTKAKKKVTGVKSTVSGNGEEEDQLWLTMMGPSGQLNCHVLVDQIIKRLPEAHLTALKRKTRTGRFSYARLAVIVDRSVFDVNGNWLVHRGYRQGACRVTVVAVRAAPPRPGRDGYTIDKDEDGKSSACPRLIWTRWSRALYCQVPGRVLSGGSSLHKMRSSSSRYPILRTTITGWWVASPTAAVPRNGNSSGALRGRSDRQRAERSTATAGFTDQSSI